MFMLSEKMVKTLNYQINRELYSAYLYMSMAAYAAESGLSGAANWFEVQTKEEMTHAQKIYNYVNQHGARVILDAIEAPPKDFKSIRAAFELTLEHEKIVTGLIRALVKTAKEENDTATEIFLQWFVTEQVEEEASASEILQRLKLVGDEGGGLFMIDRELGTRTFAPPVINQE
jgi:ferritin